jgi:hypothetical protein
MARYIRIVILILGFYLAAPVASRAQDGSTNTESSIATSGGRAQRRDARRKWKAERRKKHNSDKSLKNYKKRTQTKETRKRMKADLKKANLNNEHKREFFLKRWFNKKRIKTTKKKDR